MNIRDQFENEFPGCTSQRRIDEQRQAQRKIDRQILDLRHKVSGLDKKGVYIYLKDEDVFHRCRITHVSKETVNVHVPEFADRFRLELPQLRSKGFIWFFQLGDRLWSGRFLQQRLRQRINDFRKERDRIQRRITQMEWNWTLFELALTEAEVMHAEFRGLSLAEVLLDTEPLKASSTGWKKEGF